MMTLCLRSIVAAISMVCVLPNCEADDVIASLNESRDELPQQWTPDMVSDVDFEWLDFNGDPRSIERLPNGLRQHRSMTAGVREIRTCVSVSGDFDIDVSYHDLEISDGKPTWHCGVGLMIQFDNHDRNRVTIHRRRDRIRGQQVLAMSLQKMDDEGQMVYAGGKQVADESVSGKLRLARRGNIITAVHCALDGSGERVVGRVEAPPGPVEVQGVRLITQVGERLETSVTWNDLHVRAEKIETYLLPADGKTAAQIVKQLNQNRENLANLTDDVNASTGEGGLVWRLSPQAMIAPDEPGFRLLVEASGDVESAIIRKRCQISGDLDLHATLNIIHIDPSTKPSTNNDVTLCFFSLPRTAAGGGVGRIREDQTAELIEATLSLRYKYDGTKELNCRTIGRNHLGQSVYRPIRSIPIDSVGEIRIAVSDQTIYFLYSVPDEDEVFILARLPIEHEFIVHAIGVIQNVRGATGRSEVQWKSVQIHGDE